jgi:hypothetical protein
MARFKSTNNLFGIEEYFEPKWMESNSIILPPGGPDDPKYKWDYSRELKIEDVDVWEILYEASNGIGVFAAWLPYAEFYLIRKGWEEEAKGFGWETYYGAGAQQKIQRRLIELNIPYSLSNVWVDDDEMWLYSNPEKKIIIA